MSETLISVHGTKPEAQAAIEAAGDNHSMTDSGYVAYSIMFGCWGVHFGWAVIRKEMPAP